MLQAAPKFTKKFDQGKFLDAVSQAQQKADAIIDLMAEYSRVKNAWVDGDYSNQATDDDFTGEHEGLTVAKMDAFFAAFDAVKAEYEKKVGLTTRRADIRAISKR